MSTSKRRKRSSNGTIKTKRTKKRSKKEVVPVPTDDPNEPFDDEDLMNGWSDWDEPPPEWKVLLDSATNQLNDIVNDVEIDTQIINHYLEQKDAEGFEEARLQAVVVPSIRFKQINGKNVLHRWAIGLMEKEKENPTFRGREHEVKVLTPIWKILLSHGAANHINELSHAHSYSPLHYAGISGNCTAIDLICSLPETDFNVYSGNEYRRTPFMSMLKNTGNSFVRKAIYHMMKYYYARIDFGYQDTEGKTVGDLINDLYARSENYFYNRELQENWIAFIRFIRDVFEPGVRLLLAQFMFSTPMPGLTQLVFEYWKR